MNMPYAKSWSIKTQDWELVALKWDVIAGRVQETWRPAPGNTMVRRRTPMNDKAKDKKQPGKKNKPVKTTKKEKTVKKEEKNKKGRAGCSRA